MNDFASDEIMAKYPCFVVAPQCPKEQKWVDVNWSAPAHEMPAQPAGPLRLTMEVIAALEKEFSIDPARIYVTGLSMGGYGTWDAIARYPGASPPRCRSVAAATRRKPRRSRTCRLGLSRRKDGVVKPQRSRDMIEAMKAAGGTPSTPNTRMPATIPGPPPTETPNFSPGCLPNGGQAE